MDFIFRIRETLTCRSNASTVQKHRQLFYKKIIAFVGVKMFWKEKVWPELRETQCVHVELSSSVWCFSSPTHLGANRGGIRSDLIWPDRRSWTARAGSRGIPGSCSVQTAKRSPRHRWRFWNASTNTDKRKGWKTTARAHFSPCLVDSI